MSKAFVGFWIDKEARKKLKMICADKEIYQADVLELLVLKWLKAKENEH